MSIIERVKALNLPKGEFVVIGSGLLDAWGIRESNDTDLVASESLFSALRESGKYKIGEKYGSQLLHSDDLEIWPDWKADATFEVLSNSAVEVDGIKFVHPDILIKRKRESGTSKDLKDIQLLKDYLAR